MDDTSKHNATVRRSFDQQVPLFTGATSPFAGRGVPDRWGPLDAGTIVLEVACGAGHVAEQLAPHVRQVVGIDLTPALLDLGARRMAEAGIGNVLLQEGDAAALPFVAGSFDLVVCRSSLHHFGDVERSLREMGRVCREGGRVIIDELVQPPGTDAATHQRYDDVHRLLDPSHLHALTDDELAALIAGAVGPLTHRALGEAAVLSLEAIVTDASDRDAVWAAIEGELAGGPPTGFAPRRVGDTVEVAFHSGHFRVDRGAGG